jgi:hypothetical protein
VWECVDVSEPRYEDAVFIISCGHSTLQSVRSIVTGASIDSSFKECGVVEGKECRRGRRDRLNDSGRKGCVNLRTRAKKELGTLRRGGDEAMSRRR